MKSLKKLGKYVLLFFLIIIIGFFLLMVFGPKNGASFPPTNIPSTTAMPPPSATPRSPIGTHTAQPSISEQLAEIDRLLSQSMLASIAFNAPSSMDLDGTTTIELLLNPALSPTQVGGQIIEPGQVVTASVEITPRMRAELFARDKDSFEIQSIQVGDEQVISGTETTRWSWYVTAKKSGQQALTLVVYRLVKYDGLDYWREVETYEADIYVKVTLGNQLRSLDWKWSTATIISAILIPAFWRWFDHRKKRRSVQVISSKHKK
jgi:hypothetical protein